MPDFVKHLDLNFEPRDFALKEQKHFTPTKTVVIFKYAHVMPNASSLLHLLNIDKLPRTVTDIAY